MLEIDEFGNEQEKSNINLKQFAMEPQISSNDYTISYQWNKLDKTIKNTNSRIKSYTAHLRQT